MELYELLNVFEDSIFYNLNVEERNENGKENHYCTNNYGDDMDKIDLNKYGNDEIIWCDVERNRKRNILNVGIIHYTEDEKC